MYVHMCCKSVEAWTCDCWCRDCGATSYACNYVALSIRKSLENSPHKMHCLRKVCSSVSGCCYALEIEYAYARWALIFLFSFKAKTRGIGIPNDLETEINTIINRSKLVLKHTRHWMSHRQRRDSLIVTVSKDYRNIIEGLQVQRLS